MNADGVPLTKAKVLRLTQFGNPVLRKVSRQLTAAEVSSPETKALIAAMKHSLLTKKLGVGLAAPQVGEGVAIAVITIRPLPHRPEVKPFDLVLINPSITGHNSRRTSMWEGCLSAGNNSTLFAKVPRYKKITVKYLDENGKSKTGTFEGLPAHVIQHEADHLSGILFVDRVRDTKTYITLNEYIKLKKKSQKKVKAQKEQ